MRGQEETYGALQALDRQLGRPRMDSKHTLAS